jgi:hypothetical protein
VPASRKSADRAPSHHIELSALETNMATMAKYRIGRVALHLMCILRGADHRMHLAGVMRELLLDRC